MQMDDIIFDLDLSILQSQSNKGTQFSRPEAWAKNIISVGGVYHFDTLSRADDAWNNGASIGPAEDGRIKPDLSATTTGLHDDEHVAAARSVEGRRVVLVVDEPFVVKT